MTPVSGSLRDAVLIAHKSDSVAVALRNLEAGLDLPSIALCPVLPEAIPAGHKIALRAHEPGEAVIKFGEAIGLATSQIHPGDHVHSHNLRTALTGELEYSPPDLARTSSEPADASLLWRGYRRADGRAASRNEIWILPTVGCVAPLAERIARDGRIAHRGRIDDIVAFGHPHGCSQLGDDLDRTRSLLAGLCDNPNAGGVLLLGLGCESNQLDALVDAVPAESRTKLRCLGTQSAGDESEMAARLIADLVEQCAPAIREEMPLSALCVGLKCGGSDGFSGLTANPLLGRFSDRLAAARGQVILTEIPELFGAERALLARSCSREVFDRAAALINRFKRHYLDHGLPVSENPSPGNIAGGITTLEEKSLGAVQKAGRVPLAGVAAYGMRAEAAGLNLLEAPGNDAVSATALAAAGATLILFTTGRGTPLGFPVPTIKIASNTALAQAKPHWIDFDAGALLTGDREAIDESFLTLIIEIAGGAKTAAERGDHRAIAIWKSGVTL